MFNHSCPFDRLWFEQVGHVIVKIGSYPHGASSQPVHKPLGIFLVFFLTGQSGCQGRADFLSQPRVQALLL